MKALMYLGEQKLAVQDVPEPNDDFVVKVLGCAICGTDLKTYLKGHPFFKPPTILGHEFYGVVDRAPSGTGYKPGDFVSVAPYGECGVCGDCLNGNGEMCSHKGYVETGAFCEKVGVPLDFVERGVFRISEPDMAFSLVEPLACVLDGVEQMNVTDRNSVLVIGGGPMGALIAFTMQDMGVKVHVAELSDYRRKCLAGWGIPVSLLEDCRIGDYDRVFVAVNKKELVEKAISDIANCGSVHVFAGMPAGTMLNVDAYALHYRKVSLMGSSGFTLKQFRRAFSLISANPGQYRRLITHTFPLDDGAAAFNLLQRGMAFKIVLKP